MLQGQCRAPLRDQAGGGCAARPGITRNVGGRGLQAGVVVPRDAHALEGCGQRCRLAGISAAGGGSIEPIGLQEPCAALLAVDGRQRPKAQLGCLRYPLRHDAQAVDAISPFRERRRIELALWADLLPKPLVLSLGQPQGLLQYWHPLRPGALLMLRLPPEPLP